MLKKLRLKFILFCMIIVTVLLSVIFGLLYYSTQSSLERDSLQMMQRLAANPMQTGFPGKLQENVRLPYFTVRTNSVGDITDIGGGFFDLSDETLVLNIMRELQDRHTDSGVLKDYNLRYLSSETPLGKITVFADMTSEQATLHGLIRSFALIGGITFLALLGISILLARWAVKPVETAWDQQRQFVADASHELKTPLTVIMTNAELMSSSECSDEDRQRFSGNILTMSGQMRGLVESLLELARIDNGSKQAVKSRFNLSDCVSESAMLFEPLFFEKELPFRYDIEPELYVNGNYSQLKQLTEILLDNAAKYARPMGETVLSLRQGQKKQIILDVSDEGEPISEEDLNNLFKRFYRADKARAMNHSYGLGLSIAQSICTEHGGTISAKSCDGINSFTVTLPREK